MMNDARSGSGLPHICKRCREHILCIGIIYDSHGWSTTGHSPDTDVGRIKSLTSSGTKKKCIYRHNEMMVVVENDLALLYIKYNGLRYNPLFLGCIARPFYGDQSLRTSFFFSLGFL